MRKPKFYGLRVFNTAYGTSGGIKVNGKTEVLTKEGKTIPGLYAAGDIILGEYSGDMVNQGLQSFGFALTTGRIAGKSVLEYLKNVLNGGEESILKLKSKIFVSDVESVSHFILNYMKWTLTKTWCV